MSARRHGVVRALLVFGCCVSTCTVARAQTGTVREGGDEPLRSLGLAVSVSGAARDTLGLLVSSVTRDGPAEQAGINTGNRILAVNGIATRLTPNEIGRRAASDSALSRLTRALRVTPARGDVLLTVSGGGAVRTVAVAIPPQAAPEPTRTPPEAPTEAARRDTTLPRIVEVLGQVQLELRRAARTTPSLAAGDSLADIDGQLSEIRRRLRAVSGVTTVAPAADSAAARVDTASVVARWLRAADRLDAKPARTTPAVAPPVAVAAAEVSVTPPAPAVTVAPPAPVLRAAHGIELAKVSGDLAAYLGAQADSALVIVQASEAYEPLRAGDVVLQADGVAPDAERIGLRLASHARVSLVLLRRGRVFTVLVGDVAH